MDKKTLDPAQKAAALLSIVDESTASYIWNSLSNEEIKKIYQATKNLPELSEDQVLEIELEYAKQAEHPLLMSQERVGKLTKKRAPSALSQEILEANLSQKTIWEKLEILDPSEIYYRLEKDNNAVLATILSFCSAKTSSMVLMEMEPERASIILKEMAKISPLLANFL